MQTIIRGEAGWTAELDARYEASRGVGMVDGEVYFMDGCILFTLYEDTREVDAIEFSSKQEVGRYLKRLLAD